MVTVDGVMVTFDASLVASVTVTFAGEGEGKVTAKVADWPGVKTTLAGKLIPPAFWTVTLAVPSVTFGALAFITAEPAATPVTGTIIEVVL